MATITLELSVEGYDNSELDNVASLVETALRRGLKPGVSAEVTDELDREEDEVEETDKED